MFRGAKKRTFRFGKKNVSFPKVETFRFADYNYGIRTDRYKLIFYYGESLGMTGTKNESRTPEWELYDLKEDPMEMKNLYNDPSKKALIKELKTKLLELKQQYDDEDSKYPTMAEIARKYYW